MKRVLPTLHIARGTRVGSICSVRLSVLLMCVWLVSQGDPMASADPPDLERAIAIVNQHCIECHGKDEPEGDLRLTEFVQADTSIQSMVKHRATWDKIRTRVLQGDMPPKNSQPLAIDDRQWFPRWVSQTFRQEACGRGLQCGPAPLRRLNRNQYGNTLRDLLGVHFDAGHELPADGAGGEGFDNSAETLFLSPIHGEKYLAAAKEALEYAARDASARERIFVSRPKEGVAPEQAAREIIERFASRAFRRPVASDQLDRLLKVFSQDIQSGAKFDDAILHTLQAVLISPNFLFMLEPLNESDEPKRVDDYALASRLSYFLWDTLPDRELRKAASESKLHEEAEWERQTLRMLKQERLHEMCESFVGQWLGTRELGRTVRPDPVLYPKMIDEVADAYREEPVRLFEYILRENRSLLELIDSDYAFMNEDLLRTYRIDRKSIKEDVNQNLKRLALPDDSPRGGLVTMAGVLTVSSYPNRTSPVLRGKWLLETLLGDPPPAPPPGVPPLSDKDEDKSGKSLRQRLELHRQDATCAACHDRLDPLGFALENFDPIGRFRKEDNGVPVDSEGALPTGEKIIGSDGLKKLLMDRREQFVRQVITKMLGYALGRGLVDSDYCVVDAISDDLTANNYQSHRLILGIVKSTPFQYRAK